MTTPSSCFRLGRQAKHVCSLSGADHLFNIRINPLMKFLFKLIIVSEYHPLHKNLFRSIGAIAFEQRRHVQSRLWYVIHPFSIFSMVWQIIFVFIIAIHIINMPFCQRRVLSFVLQNYTQLLEWLCVLNVIVKCFTGYVDKESMEVVINLRLIVRKYMRGYFFMDLISCLPIHKLVHFAIGLEYFSYGYIRFHAFSYFHIWQFRLFRSYSQTLLALFNVNEYFLDTFNVGFLLFFVYHFLTCFMSFMVFFIHGTEIANNKDSWLNTIRSAGAYTALSYIIPQGKVSDDNHIYYVRNTERDPFRYYIICAHRTLSMLYSLGTAGKDSKSPEDVYFNISYILLGKLLMFYLIGKLLKCRSWVMSPTVKYHMLMKQVSAYMRRKQLPPSIQRKVRLYFEYRFDKRFFEERVILANLSQNLRTEIRIQECRRLVMESMLFRNAPISVVERILTRLKQDVYLPNDVVMKAGQVGDCMFFLVSGTVAVLSRSGDEILHLKDGSFFGELALLGEEERRMSTVIAIEVCEVYRLNKDDFHQVLRPMSELYSFIQEVAEKRMQELVGIEEMYKRLHASQSKMSGTSRVSASSSRITNVSSRSSQKIQS